MRRVTKLVDLPQGKRLAAQLPTGMKLDGAVSYLSPEGRRFRLWGPACSYPTQEAALAGLPLAGAVFWSDAPVVPPPRPRAAPVVGRTAAALALLDQNPGMTQYEAARHAGVHVSAVYRATRRKLRARCPACGRLILPGSENQLADDSSAAANARLIAAAPDLLHHLTRLIRAIDRMPANAADGLAEEARELIARFAIAGETT